MRGGSWNITGNGFLLVNTFAPLSFVWLYPILLQCTIVMYVHDPYSIQFYSILLCCSYCDGSCVIGYRQIIGKTKVPNAVRISMRLHVVD